MNRNSRRLEFVYMQQGLAKIVQSDKVQAEEGPRDSSDVSWRCMTELQRERKGDERAWSTQCNGLEG